MPQDGQVVFVYADWGNDGPQLMGKLHHTFFRGTWTTSFEYDNTWLRENHTNHALDPDLSLYSGRQYTPTDETMFGIFSDSCPDRWGRTLLKRKEALDAREQHRKPKRLSDMDYLLGVYDTARMGALRFKLDIDGPFLSDDSHLSTPPWVKLRTLEHAALAFEQDEDGMDAKWLKQLLGPCSSSGGARPKVSVLDEDGSLWVAKFPSKHDKYNNGAWEKVVHDLAKMCGLNVPRSKLESFSSVGSTFLVQRFDRRGQKRIHFSSAMTLLKKTDGASGQDGSSYLDIAGFIRREGAKPKDDLKELWKRIVFNMAVSNTDDHLRNHGFLLDETGWRLSPLFDVNPIPDGSYLSLNVTPYDSSIDIGLALEVAQYFDISKKEASDISMDLVRTVSTNWETLALQYGLSPSAIEHMRPAFMC